MVEAGWNVVQPILDVGRRCRRGIPQLRGRLLGPKEADELIERDSGTGTRFAEADPPLRRRRAIFYYVARLVGTSLRSPC